MLKKLYIKAFLRHYPLNTSKNQHMESKVVRLCPNTHTSFQLYRDREGRTLLGSRNLVMDIHSEKELELFCESHFRAFRYRPRISVMSKEFIPLYYKFFR